VGECSRGRARDRGPLVAVVGLALEREHQDVVELLGKLGAHLGRRTDRCVRHRAQRVDVVRVAEEPLAGDELPTDHADGPDVAPAIGLLPAQALGRDVSELSLEHPRLRAMPLARGRGDAEVDDLRHAVERHHDVARRDVAMNHGERLAVRVRQLVRCMQALARVGQRLRDQARGARGIAAAGTRGLAPDLGHRLADEVLHRDVRAPRRDVVVVQAAHVRMTDARRDLGLVDEHLREHRIVREVRMDELHGRETRGAPGALVAREIDGGHSARRDLEAELIGAYPKR
jgi:hypothetical protein